MDVSKNNGTQKWMVYFMENPIKMDDLGVPPIFGNPRIELRDPSVSGDPIPQLFLRGREQVGQVCCMLHVC